MLSQLEESVAELEAEGFDDEELLQAWKAQIGAAWASVPPEVLAARKARADAQAMAAERAEAAKKGVFARASDLLSNARDTNLNEVLDAIGDSLPAEVEFDVSKWRLRLKKKMRKKYIPKENRNLGE